MTYIENPKTKGSGILCAIPQGPESLPCKRGCSDCFFQGGRSYLEPLVDNLPNLPDPEIAKDYVVRVNDGLDSNQELWKVLQNTEQYYNRFYNTSYPAFDLFERPVVLTVNPEIKRDKSFIKVNNPPDNLMFVRFVANMWNITLLDEAIKYYCDERQVPLVITFMSYYKDKDAIAKIKKDYVDCYKYKKRILNSSWVINHRGWNAWIYSDKHKNNPLVSTCGRDADHHLCKDCGVCLREYYKTKTRMLENGTWR